MAQVAAMSKRVVASRSGLPTGHNKAKMWQRSALRLSSANKPTVVVTREAGKNGKLMKELGKLDMECIELPLIEHAPGPDRTKLASVLNDIKFEWIAITSPEAAAVFVEGWTEAGRPEVQLAVVGGGTGEALEAAGLKAAFVASKATGKTMGSELPRAEGGGGAVLYPASCKASTDLQDSLAAGGFAVTRLNTYDTRGVTAVEPSLLRRALDADVVTFGSPSAVKAWVALVGAAAAAAKPAACIGATSARACDAAGLPLVYYPESPGIEGWVQAVQVALTATRHAVPQPV